MCEWGQDGVEVGVCCAKHLAVERRQMKYYSELHLSYEVHESRKRYCGFP